MGAAPSGSSQQGQEHAGTGGSLGSPPALTCRLPAPLRISPSLFLPPQRSLPHPLAPSEHLQLDTHTPTRLPACQPAGSPSGRTSSRVPAPLSPRAAGERVRPPGVTLQGATVSANWSSHAAWQRARARAPGAVCPQTWGPPTWGERGGCSWRTHSQCFSRNPVPAFYGALACGVFPSPPSTAGTSRPPRRPRTPWPPSPAGCHHDRHLSVCPVFGSGSETRASGCGLGHRGGQGVRGTPPPPFLRLLRPTLYLRPLGFRVRGSPRRWFPLWGLKRPTAGAKAEGRHFLPQRGFWVPSGDGLTGAAHRWRHGLCPTQPQRSDGSQAPPGTWSAPRPVLPPLSTSPHRVHGCQTRFRLKFSRQSR